MAKITQEMNAAGRVGRYSLMLRPWARLADDDSVLFALADCFTFASSVAWVDIAYELEGLPLFYTHALMQMADWLSDERVEDLLAGRSPGLIEESWCPAARLSVMAQEDAGEGERRFSVQLNASLPDYGAASRAEFSFRLHGLSTEAVRDFARDLGEEVRSVWAGRCPVTPDQALAVPPLELSRRLNADAYDAIGQGYACDYLGDDLLRSGFEQWAEALPPGGAVLDVGCGAGQPVAAELVRRGYRITGIDVSPRMLAIARAEVAGAEFLELSATELQAEAQFDGACVWYAFLNMDPIEMRVALARLHRALKPGGAALIADVQSNTRLRMEPVDEFMGQIVWQWKHRLSEVLSALTEHGLFEVASTAQRDPPAQPEATEIPGPERPVAGEDGSGLGEPGPDGTAMHHGQGTLYTILARAL